MTTRDSRQTEYATSQTLNHALGNLGGRPPSWITASQANTPVAKDALPPQGQDRASTRSTVLPHDFAQQQNQTRTPPSAGYTSSIGQQPVPQAAHTARMQRHAQNAALSASIQQLPLHSSANLILCPTDSATLPQAPETQQWPKLPTMTTGRTNPASTVAPAIPLHPGNRDHNAGARLDDDSTGTSSTNTYNQCDSISLNSLTDSLSDHITRQNSSSSTRGHSLLPQVQQLISQSIGLDAELTTAAPLAQVYQLPDQTTGHSWYISPQSIQSINNFELSQPSLTDYDKHRCNILRNALHRKDCCHLTLHQYYCLYDYHESIQNTTPSDHPLRAATNVIEEGHGSNKLLTPSLLAFFSRFPRPIQDLQRQWPDQFRQQAIQFSSFVARAPNYIATKTLHQQRKCPPTAREFFVDFNISSLTFQSLLFIHSLRCIFGQGLRKDLQMAFETRAAASFGTMQLDVLQKLLTEKNVTGLRYQQLRMAEVEQLRSQLVEVRRHVIKHRQPVPSGQKQLTAIAQTLPPSMNQHTHQTANRNSSDVSPFEAVPSQGNATLSPYLAQTLNVRPGLRSGQLHQNSDRATTDLRTAWEVMQPQVLRAQLLPSLDCRPLLQRIPRPEIFSLHQAHLRSPTLQARNLSTPLHRWAFGFLLKPARLTDVYHKIQRWDFHLSPDDMRTLAKTEIDDSGGPGTRLVNEKTWTARLCCIKWPDNEKSDKLEFRWMASDVSWVPHMYLTLNNVPLESRRKIHHGSDLPIDVTSLLQAGENTLEITVMAKPGDNSFVNYMVAVETLGFRPHEPLKRFIIEKCRLSAHDVLQDIKKKLSSGTLEDDDIAVVGSGLTINLFDPFSASKICDVPVRSDACSHNDCFDLETFLITRKRDGDATAPNHWRCPICKAAAQPSYLKVDSFIEEVYQTLQEQGLSHTRAIVVQQDGSWKPKEVLMHARGTSDTAEEKISITSTNVATADIEIIDISD